MKELLASDLSIHDHLGSNLAKLTATNPSFFFISVFFINLRQQSNIKE